MRHKRAISWKRCKSI